jgi:hypothetical protein
MSGNWTYADLIDLECFLAGDGGISHADLHRRDRQLFLDFPEKTRKDEERALIRRWLLERRSQEYPQGNSPGQAVVETFKSLSIILAVCGAFLGVISGLTFFTYSGTTPVNVINFLFIFVFSQILLLLFLIIGAGLRLAGLDILPAPMAGLYRKTLTWFMGRSKKIRTFLPGAEPDDMIRVMGLLKKQRLVYGTAFYWPLFSLSQRVMVGFNLGLLAATCFRILTSDIAFGWQSTIQFSTDFMARTVKLLALPWSWIVPPAYSYPSAAQIEGSRIILKDGIFHLQTQDLVSWWPFLVLCIVFYGILVRLLLVVIGNAGQWKALRNPKTGRPLLVQLVGRMKSPLIRSQGAPPEPGSRSPSFAGEDLNDNDASTSGSPAIPLLLLVSEDIAGNYTDDVWNRHLSAGGFSVLDSLHYRQEPEADRALFNTLAHDPRLDRAGIIMVMESWMPPINQTLEFIKKLRAAVGEQIPLFVGLVGPGSDQQHIYQPAPVERKIWHRKLDILADPYLSLLDLGTERKDAT